MQPQALLGTLLIVSALAGFLNGMSYGLSLAGVATGLLAHVLRARRTIQR